MLSKTHSKYIQSLHNKKSRDTENVFIAEGNKTVPELLSAGNFDCKELLALTGWLQQHSVFLQKYFHGVVHELLPHEMEKISALATPGEVLAVFEKQASTAFDPKGKISLLLDTIQDPGNLGTIIRIADWFGVQNIVCSATCADMYNPKVVQATMGSLGRVNLLYTEIGKWLIENKHVASYAAALDGQPVQQHKGLKEGVIVIGNESKGISEEVMRLCTHKITIQKIGQAESLNAAVATGIILSHIV
ncbi:MAG TPA: RNA methyltransferase [Ferruginibacter sp.]|nr:RNA methyltransferase [Ferruginibacter sp.]HPH92510.1 RNA methyltransferase [Ferruginibacter sp.]